MENKVDLLKSTRKELVVLIPSVQTVCVCTFVWINANWLGVAKRQVQLAKENFLVETYTFICYYFCLRCRMLLEKILKHSYRA